MAYAPSFVPFDETKSFFKINTEVNIKLNEFLKCLVGYRDIRFRGKSDNTISNFYVGFGFVF
jgi:hypothetical protein